MKTRGATLVITLLVFIFPAAGFAKSCSEGRSEQHQIGPETLLKTLRDKAKAGSTYALFFEQGEFDTETFTYVGKIKSATGQNFHLAFLETIWGASCRRTSRLMVFSDDYQYLGNYDSIPETKIRVEGSRLVFVANESPKQESEMVFQNDAPPNPILVDGDLHFFSK